jgi:hypothetical protein
MFCPKCAAQNLEGAKFCRACGADIRLVPQALVGRLVPAPGATDDEIAEAVEARPTTDVAVQNIFKGVAFLLVVLAGFFFLRTYWMTIWFIIPALSNIGRGVGQLVRARQEARLGAPAHATTALRAHATQTLAAAGPAGLAPADTNELVPPPASITEGTTRHLNAVQKSAPEEL